MKKSIQKCNVCDYNEARWYFVNCIINMIVTNEIRVKNLKIIEKQKNFYTHANVLFKHYIGRFIWISSGLCVIHSFDMGFEMKIWKLSTINMLMVFVFIWDQTPYTIILIHSNYLFQNHAQILVTMVWYEQSWATIRLRCKSKSV